MKTTLAIIGLVVLCGCADDPPPGSGYSDDFNVITNSGHRFAIVHYDGRVGLCEVTDASLVEKK